MIPQSQISKLSNRLLKEQGGRRIPENILERDYCIAWFLVGYHAQLYEINSHLKVAQLCDDAIFPNIDFQKILILHFCNRSPLRS